MRSKALFWSKKRTAVLGAGPRCLAAPRIYWSTASGCAPSRAAHAGPGSVSATGSRASWLVAEVMLGPHCPPRLAA
eukprot:217594-Pyramimonas_sp.AAC.1